MADTAQVNRTREIEGFSNLYFIHPLSRRLVSLFARLGIRPNTVSAMGIIFGVLAAAFYFQYEVWYFTLAGFLSMIMWHVLDGADGQLARLTGQTSEFGRVMDGLCDHVTVTLVYVSLAVAGAQHHGAWVFVAAVLAGISHFGQSTAYEFQRQMYDYWVYGKQSARFVSLDEQRALIRSQNGVSRMFSRAYLFYLLIQSRCSSFDERLDRQLHQLTEGYGPDQSRVRDLYRTVNVSAMKRWTLMSNNPRTIVIFLACLVQQPVLYFLLEITVMNVIFALLVRMQSARYGVLKTRLEEIGEENRKQVLATQ